MTDSLRNDYICLGWGGGQGVEDDSECYGEGGGEPGTPAKEPVQGPRSNYFTRITFCDMEHKEDKNTSVDSGSDLVISLFLLKAN